LPDRVRLVWPRHNVGWSRSRKQVRRAGGATHVSEVEWRRPAKGFGRCVSACIHLDDGAVVMVQVFRIAPIG